MDTYVGRDLWMRMLVVLNYQVDKEKDKECSTDGWFMKWMDGLSCLE